MRERTRRYDLAGRVKAPAGSGTETWSNVNHEFRLSMSEFPGWPHTERLGNQVVNLVDAHLHIDAHHFGERRPRHGLTERMSAPAEIDSRLDLN